MKAQGLGRLYRAALRSFLGNPRITSIRTTGAFAFPIVSVPAFRTTLGSIELRNHIDMVKRASQRFYFQRRHSILSPGFVLVRFYHLILARACRRHQNGCLLGIAQGSFAATHGFGWIAEGHFIGPGDAPATINAALIGAGLIFPRSGLVVQSLADPVSKCHTIILAGEPRQRNSEQPQPLA